MLKPKFSKPAPLLVFAIVMITLNLGSQPKKKNMGQSFFRKG
jgi:hypothetical protein